MKKILAIAATLVLSLTACADRQQLISFNALPAAAQTFVKQYFNPSDIAYVGSERDGLHTEYNVRLNDATELEFDLNGNLREFDD